MLGTDGSSGDDRKGREGFLENSQDIFWVLCDDEVNWMKFTFVGTRRKIGRAGPKRKGRKNFKGKGKGKLGHTFGGQRAGK